MSEEQKKKTLKEFIEYNYHLLTAIGVFGVLTILFTSIENGQALSFLSFFVFFVLCWELLEPKMVKWEEWEHNTFKLNIFKTLLFLLVISLAFYLVMTYTVYTLAYWVLFTILFVVTSMAIIVNFLERHKTTGKVVGYVLSGILFFCLPSCSNSHIWFDSLSSWINPPTTIDYQKKPLCLSEILSVFPSLKF